MFLELLLVYTYLLFPPLLPLVLCVLQHLFSPKVKEVRWIGVELQALLSIIPADISKTKKIWLAH